MVKNSKTKGLGRGIDALFTNEFSNFDEIEQIDTNKEHVQELVLAEIRPNPYQPRKEFDEETLQELAESIKANGVFQPIIVRKSKIKGYELIAGERRLRASKLAGKSMIPAIVRDYSEDMMIQIAVIENLQREDLKPIDEAMAYRMLMEQLHLNQEQVSERVGKSRPYIANYLRLLTLPNKIQEFVQSGNLSVGHARTLLALKDSKQMVLVAKKSMQENMTVRALEDYVQKLNEPVKPIKKNKKQIHKPLYITESEEKLMDKFGTSVQIVEKGDKGKIEIEYLSQKDLTRILDLLEIELDV